STPQPLIRVMTMNAARVERAGTPLIIRTLSVPGIGDVSLPTSSCHVPGAFVNAKLSNQGRAQ
ncbi:hypothetical protein UK99_05065, partial [Frankia casuarinae]